MDRISRLLKKKHFRTIFPPLSLLRNLLDKTKDLVDSKLKKGVYSIPCSCERLYIGETSHSIKVRLKENCSDILHNKTKSSAVAEHSIKNNHYFCIEHVKVISIEEHYSKRCIREAVEIEKHTNFFLIEMMVWFEVIFENLSSRN